MGASCCATGKAAVAGAVGFEGLRSNRSPERLRASRGWVFYELGKAGELVLIETLSLLRTEKLSSGLCRWHGMTARLPRGDSCDALGRSALDWRRRSGISARPSLHAQSARSYGRATGSNVPTGSSGVGDGRVGDPLAGDVVLEARGRPLAGGVVEDALAGDARERARSRWQEAARAAGRASFELELLGKDFWIAGCLEDFLRNFAGDLVLAVSVGDAADKRGDDDLRAHLRTARTAS